MNWELRIARVEEIVTWFKVLVCTLLVGWEKLRKIWGYDVPGLRNNLRSGRKQMMRNVCKAKKIVCCTAVSTSEGTEQRVLESEGGVTWRLHQTTILQGYVDCSFCGCGLINSKTWDGCYYTRACARARVCVCVYTWTCDSFVADVAASIWEFDMDVCDSFAFFLDPLPLKVKHLHQFEHVVYMQHACLRQFEHAVLMFASTWSHSIGVCINLSRCIGV